MAAAHQIEASQRRPATPTTPALTRLAPRPVTEAVGKICRASVEVSASRLLADDGESYTSEIIETTRTETSYSHKVLARYVR
jgi:hypothetical protein